MDKIGYHYVIQYFHLKGLSPTNIKAELDYTLAESAPSFTTIKYWVTEFKGGRTSRQDEHRILTGNLGMRKLCERWMSRLLTMEQG